MPLDLAFARTIHKFQGLSAGAVDDGKIPNIYRSIICDPDVKQAEGRNTGLFYTAVSRGTSLGNADGLGSAIYFTGCNLTVDRIKNLTKKSRTNLEYVNVTRRKDWVSHLDSHTVPMGDITSQECLDILTWTKQTYTYEALFQRTQMYCQK